MKLEQFKVTADRSTGEWITEPEFVAMVDRDAWNAMTDTDETHFDTFETPSEDGGTVTCAIAVDWA